MLTVIADKENIRENEIVITDKSDCNHIQNVFRLGNGDELRVIDGEFEYLTEITNVTKKEKWDTTVRETLKQCKGVKFTKIAPVTKLQSINYELYDKIVYAYENSHNTESLVNIVNKNDKSILYIVGPEGGITEEEVNFLKDKGAIEISLGKRILRAETAAIVIGGILANVYN